MSQLMGKTLFLLSLVMVLVSHPSLAWSSASSMRNLTDQSALLAFKSRITFKPNDVMVNNWTTNTSFCNWIGILCSSSNQRVIALNLSYMDLQGTIPPQIGNLSFLMILDLHNNSFHGHIPESIGHLPDLIDINLRYNQLEGMIPPSLSLCQKLQKIRLDFNHLEGSIPKELGYLLDLRVLSLRSNRLRANIPSTIFNISTLQVVRLADNNLSSTVPVNMCVNLRSLELLDLGLNMLNGPIPTNLCQCGALQQINLWQNNFTGSIPGDIGCLSQLKFLNFGMNQLTGTIPLSLGNLTQLQYLDFRSNNLFGGIPHELANLPKITFLSIGFNNLTGEIPRVLFNISSIETISLSFNNLSGYLPEFTNLQHPNLKEIFVRSNQLIGNIPISISNASKLVMLELSKNFFSGPIPKSLGSLQFLETLNLQGNQLSSKPATKEIEFLTSLTRCRVLKYLLIAFNPLTGILPSSIGNLSTSLIVFSVVASQIGGGLPPTIGNLSSVIYLAFSKNNFTGPVPSTIGALDKLQRLHLSGNNIQGPIPNEICHLAMLGELILDDNNLFGPVPNCIGNLSRLQKLSLAFNALTLIPSSLWKLSDMWFLDLSKNKLSGNLSSAISSLKILSVLDLSNNSFEGNIPGTVGGLSSLETMDLSFNSLSGMIPRSLEKLLNLKLLNLSFNRLEGEVPNGGAFANLTIQSLIGNYDLCGISRLQLSPCPSGAHHKLRNRNLQLLYALLPVTLVIVLVVLLYLIVKYRVRRRQIIPPDTLLPVMEHTMISYYELHRATDNFSEANLLGVGSFGSIYKGQMADGMFVAVKVLDLQVEGALKSFDAECKVLRNVRHRNLVKIVSSCSNLEFRALVLAYMQNGSLEKWLYSHNYCLDLLQRINIMIDVALALEYLHHGCSEVVVHCDLKPSNVLLDEDMVAHVGDFGITKILAKYKSATQTMTLGTIGYIAPEYGSEGRVSAKGDVYSYGIMLMEIFTRKKPTDEQFVRESSLGQWVSSSFPDSVMHVVDMNLLITNQEGTWHTTKNLQHCLSSILEVALMCSKNLPEERLSMKDVVIKLKKIKQLLLYDHNTGASTSQSNF